MQQRNTTRLKTLREATGLSAYEFARQAGLANSHLSALEAGRHQPSASTLHRIAKVLAQLLEREPGAVLEDILGFSR